MNNLNCVTDYKKKKKTDLRRKVKNLLKKALEIKINLKRM